METNKPKHTRGKRPKLTALRQRMELCGLSSLELSTMVGCHRNHLNKVLSGTSLPGRRLAKSLGAVLDISPARIWTGENLPEETKFTPQKP